MFFYNQCVKLIYLILFWHQGIKPSVKRLGVFLLHIVAFNCNYSMKTMDYGVNILFLRLYAITFVCIAFKDGYKYGCVVY